MKGSSLFFDKTFLKFIAVGVLNTAIGTSVMFVCYNVFKWDYWVSSALNYIVGSILSYFLNNYVTFQRRKNSVTIIVKFIVLISSCYVIAYGVARPFVRWLLSSMPMTIQDNVAMIVGMGLFVMLNYLGQRFWAFKQED